MNGTKAGLVFSGLLAAVIAAGGLGVPAAGAPSRSPSPDKAKAIASEQSREEASGQALGLGVGERLVVKDVITDPDGSTHVRYDRTFKGLRVIGGDLVTHRGRDGQLESATRNTTKRISVASTTPKISLSSAKAAGARKASLAQDVATATQGELVLYAGGNSPGVTPKLAYDVLTTGVRADQTPSRLHTVVDAASGATLASWDEVTNGTGNGLYVGTVPIGTTAGAAGTGFVMRDAMGNHTTDLNGVSDLAGTVPGRTFTDGDDIWGNGAVTDRASAGVDAQYGAGKTFEYFKNVLGRNGIKDDGLGARSRVHYGDGYVNAFWDGTQMTYGDGAGNNKPLVELDIAGHEMTHGVTESTAGLVGTGEAGGLNEATSDIFGTAVEWYANNPSDRPDYLIGELVNVNGDGTPVRYLDRPSRDGVSPDCWSPTLGSLDLHNSAGPLNHWFYLASEGSGAKVVNGVSYNSPTCNTSTVTPIGRDKAAKIWYRTLSTYLTSNSDYRSARDGAIQSAKDLYGAGSPECAGIVASFAAIKVPLGSATCGITAPAPVGTNSLRNPGFESGAASWFGSVGPITRSTSRPARSGSWKMWLGGKGESSTQNQWQSVSIALNANAPRLSYWLRMDTAETGNEAFDTMKVQVIAGPSTSTLVTHTNVGIRSAYSLKTFDLSAYKGKTITVKFLSTEDGVLPTSFVVDDTAITTSSVTASTVILSPSDFTGDGKPDVMRVTPTGDLLLYRGIANGGIGAPTKIGVGWGSFAKMFSPGDFTGDGRSDILAVRSSGDLFLYRGNGIGGFSGSGVKIGSGWSGFTRLFSPGDFSGDGRADVLAVKASGDLFLYRGNGLGGFSGSGSKIGSGWSGFTKVFSPGDFSGDGRADVLAVKASGDLFLYRGNGLGGFTGSGAKIGAGWSLFTHVLSPGDFTGDGKADVLAVKSNGDLSVYRGNGLGGFTGSGFAVAILS